MVIWCNNFRTFEPFGYLPRAATVSLEHITLRDGYRHLGKYRSGEDHALFKYTLSGQGIFRDSAGEHKVCPGSGFLCWISDPETAYYYPQDATEPWDFIYITIIGGNTRDIVGELVGRHGPIFSLPEQGGLISRLKSLQVRGRRENTIRASWSSQLAMGLFEELTAQCDTVVEDHSQAVSTRAMKLIDSNLHRNINVSQVADMLGISREHFSRLFKQETNIKPHEYLRRQKIILACKILKETTLSIKQIAVRMGFDSPEHFSRTFKAVIHMPPRKFRQVGVAPMN